MKFSMMDTGSGVPSFELSALFNFKFPVAVQVVIDRITDDDYPDTSYIGKYTNTPTLEQAKYAIDRFEGEAAPRNELRYFVPANPDNAQEEYKRMESLERGCWGFIGIKACAMVYFIRPEGVAQRVEIESPGLWGIESDGDDEYFEEIYAMELQLLLDNLRDMGCLLLEGILEDITLCDDGTDANETWDPPEKVMKVIEELRPYHYLISSLSEDRGQIIVYRCRDMKGIEQLQSNIYRGGFDSVAIHAGKIIFSSDEEKLTWKPTVGEDYYGIEQVEIMH